MASLMQPKPGLLPLTEVELETILYTFEQPHLLQPKHKRAVRRLCRKVENASCSRRRCAIFAAGARAARDKCRATKKPEFQGQKLGSLESMRWYDGFASVRRGFVNPYRRTY